MNLPDGLLIGGAAIALLGGLYGVYRLLLKLEAPRPPRDWDKERGGSGGSVFLPLQEMIEPSIKHVYEVKEEKRQQAEEDEGEEEKT